MLFNGSEEKEYYDIMRRRALKMLEGLSRGEVVDVEDMTTSLICFAKPKVYGGSGGFEVEFDRNYETLCLSLSENLGLDAKKCTVLEFYNAVDVLQERARKAERSRK